MLEGVVIGIPNIVSGWALMVLGILSGSLIGLYAFDGPVPAPKGHESYTDLPRRMVRLAHIAFIMLPLINIVYGMHIDGAALSEAWKVWGSNLMVVGMVGVPTLLIAAAMIWMPIKYLEPIPVTCTLVGLMIIAWGYINRFYVLAGN